MSIKDRDHTLCFFCIGDFDTKTRPIPKMYPCTEDGISRLTVKSLSRNMTLSHTDRHDRTHYHATAQVALSENDFRLRSWRALVKCLTMQMINSSVGSWTIKAIHCSLVYRINHALGAIKTTSHKSAYRKITGLNSRDCSIRMLYENCYWTCNYLNIFRNSAFYDSMYFCVDLFFNFVSGLLLFSCVAQCICQRIINENVMMMMMMMMTTTMIIHVYSIYKIIISRARYYY